MVHEIPPALVLPFPLRQVLCVSSPVAGAGRGRDGAGVVQGRLGARNPAGPYISVPFAPSPARFFARGRRRLGARNPAGPCSFVSFAPSPPRFFARGRRRLGALKPASPCSSVPFAPSPPRFFARGRCRLGARNPAGPYISVPFAPSPARFFARAQAGVVPHRPLALVSLSWGTTSPEHRRKVMHERLPPAFVHHFSSIIFS